MLHWGCHVVEIGRPSCPSHLCHISTIVVRPILRLEACSMPQCVKKDEGGKLEALPPTSLLFWGA
eukprot:4891884-Ditylum_brightwellii.AAC.1